MLSNAKNCKDCFGMLADSHNCRFCQNGGYKISDAYDGYGVGEHAELLYEAFDSGVNGQRQFFVGIVYGCNDVRYCYNCTGSSNLFGCIGLRNKNYCIFNKQYTKEEFEKLRARIVEQMTKAGEYGEFFPAVISPFGYNETIAQDYFPMNEAEAKSKGYKWRNKEKSEHQPTIKATDLPDHIKDAGEGILKEIIECSGCHRVYRIIPRELDFLKRFNIALPRKCFECRHQDRFKQVNFPRLYDRQCMKCDKDIETSYSPDRPETIYCESCYNAEVV